MVPRFLRSSRVVHSAGVIAAVTGLAVTAAFAQSIAPPPPIYEPAAPDTIVVHQQFQCRESGGGHVRLRYSRAHRAEVDFLSFGEWTARSTDLRRLNATVSKIRYWRTVQLVCLGPYLEITVEGYDGSNRNAAVVVVGKDGALVGERFVRVPERPVPGPILDFSESRKSRN